CTQPAFAALDLNGDGAVDLVLLTGSTATDHKLFVFWNDRSGNFGTPQLVSAASHSPVAFSVLRPTTLRPHTNLAYATDKEIYLVAPGAPSELAAPQFKLSLTRGTGLVAADVDGDGLEDLAVVDAGDLKIFRAGLRAL
ncbi:MAG: hypothetical protein RLZZ450_4905, partial [Pseudomonadota bacterium]